jgi:hypothetical protein
LTALGADNIRQYPNYVSSTCPVHRGDNTEAFTFYTDTPQCWMCHTNMCHGAQSSDNLLGLVCKSLQMSEESGVRWLEEICGVQCYGLELATKAASLDFLKQSPRRGQNKIYDEDLLDRFIPAWESGSYYQQRGFNPQTLEYFGVRECLTMGRYFNRAIIPIHDEHGDLVGVSGRWMGDFKEDGVEKFSHTPGMVKSKILYNLHRAKRYAGCGYVFVVESPGCVWGLHEIGVYNAAAILGVNMSNDQAKLIFTDPSISTAILCFDIGGPGRIGMSRSAPKLHGKLAVQLMYLPAGKDLDNISYQDFQRCYAGREQYQGES